MRVIARELLIWLSGYSAEMEIRALGAILFDMDGTLVDSDAAVERAWATWAGRYEVDPALAVSMAHGNPADVTVRALCPDLDLLAVAEAATFQLALQYDDLHDVVPTVGAHRLIQTLIECGLGWAVVTSADQRLATARLGAVAMNPPVLITADEVTLGKPDPEGYLLAAERLAVPPAQCLVVEDTETGLEAGRSAGAMTAAVKGLDADLRLNDLGDLAALLTGSSPGNDSTRLNP